jgi:hypothetical protein
LIIEAPFYHATQTGAELGKFLPAAQEVPEISYLLSPSEQKNKRDRIACFSSRRETLSGFPVNEERYRIAPDYDFRRAPHQGLILYDRHSWGMSSQGFLNLVWEAENILEAEMKMSCS